MTFRFFADFFVNEITNYFNDIYFQAAEESRRT